MRHGTIAGLLALAGAGLLITPGTVAAKSAVYGGSIPRGDPVVLTADTKAQALKTIVVSSKLTCIDGSHDNFAETMTTVKAPAGFPSDPMKLKMKKNAKGSFNGSWTGSSQGAKYMYVAVVHVSGKLTKTSAKGSFTVREDIVDLSTMQTVTSCDTGTTRFVASRRAGQIFGGTTKQGEPVVLRVNAARRQMKSFLFSWTADCGDNGWFHEPTMGWNNLPLSGLGAFKVARSYPYQGDNGGKVVYSYTAAGKVGKTSASGSVSGKYEEIDAAGATTATCDSGSLPWKAITG